MIIKIRVDGMEREDELASMDTAVAQARSILRTDRTAVARINVNSDRTWFVEFSVLHERNVLSGFRECDTCRKKAGMPTLCAGCLHNRSVIDRLTRFA